MFVTDTKNDAGIYNLRFFIRGKPWVITIDDEMLFYGDGLNFAMVGDNENLWAPLVEKAFSKMKGNYATANGGFVPNGLRSLVGCPISDYISYEQYAETAAEDTWTTMKAADDLDYILGAGTIGSDTMLNECNIVAGHAYSVISVFELKTGETVDHQMYMIRNPWGSTSYNMDWKYDDEAWTVDYLSQVPYGIDATESYEDGVFFVEDKDFLTCFYDYQIAHYRDSEGYSKTWYDVENDRNVFGSVSYFVTPPAKSGDLYFEIETYYWGIMHPKCHPVFGLPPYLTRSIIQNGNVLVDDIGFQIFSEPFMVEEANYEAGDTFEITVNFDWGFGPEAQDYSVLVYSSQDLEVKDANGETNMMHMDGQEPSGFDKWRIYK